MASGAYRYIGFAAGAAIGAVAAIPTGGLSIYAGATLGASIGSLLGSVLDVVTAKKPESLSERNLQENLAITSAALGTFIPIIRGKQIVHGNVIDATLKQPHVIEQDTGGGGGGGKGGFGGSSQATRTTTYSITLAIALCAGPIVAIRKAWTDATLIYDDGQTGAINAAEFLNVGTGYTAGDRLTIVGGNNDAIVLVTFTAGGGAVAAFDFVSRGSGYMAGAICPSTGGTGTGMLVQITTLTHTSTLVFHTFDDAGKTGARSQNGCTDIHVHTGTETQVPCSILQDIHGAENVQGYRGLAYVVIKDLDLGTSGRVPQFQFEVESAVSNVLSDVLVDLCGQAGIPAVQVDVSRAPVRRVDFLLTNVVTVGSILESLATCYNFIGIESDSFVKFRNKAVSSAVTIPEALLSGGLDKQNTTSLSIVRMQDRELPTQVTVTYPDKTRNYQSAAQIQQLTHSIYTTDSLFQLNVPVALLPADAKILAEIVLNEAWSSRESFSFTLPPRFMALEPGDVVNVEARGHQYPMRVIEWTQGDNWLIEAKGISYDASIHRGFRAVPGVGGTGTVTLPITAAATGVSLEIPAMATTEVEPQWLFVAYTTDPERTFVSASIFESLDGGASYEYLLSSPGPAIVGRVATALPSANWHVWDHTHTIDVVLYQRALQSASELEVYNGKNWAMLGGEFIAFREALLIAPRTYRLRHLLRGRKGTEGSVGTHGSDELFTLITPTLRANAHAIYPRARIGVQALYKVVDPITNITVAPVQPYTPTGISVKPWAPNIRSILRGVPNPNDIMITWLYRSRLYGELINNSGIAWDLDFTQTFTVTIYVDGGYTAVKRVMTTMVFPDPNGPLTAFYTEAQQMVDFGSPQATIYVDVVGIGTGIAGYPARAAG